MKSHDLQWVFSPKKLHLLQCPGQYWYPVALSLALAYGAEKRNDFSMVGNSHSQEQPQLSQHRHAIHPGTLRTSPRETSILSMPGICITRALALELVPCIFLARRSHGDVPSASWQWWPFTVSWPCKYLCPQMIRLLQCSLPAVWQTFEYFCQICLDVY